MGSHVLPGAQPASHKHGSEELGEGMRCHVFPDVQGGGSSQYLLGEGLVLTEGFLKGRRDTQAGCWGKDELKPDPVPLPPGLCRLPLLRHLY